MSYAVIGHPIGHSISPLIHTMLYEYYGLDEKYTSIDIPPEHLREVFEEKLSTLKGFNVTIPHKRDVFNLVDSLDGYAQRVGAVNTVKCDGRKTKGYNTDGDGFIRALKRYSGNAVGADVVIIGAGGAAVSVAVKLSDEGAGSVTVLARDIKKAENICSKLDCKAYAGTLDDYRPHGYDIIVNATPVGMHPNEGESCVSLFQSGSIAYDLIYNPYTTAFLEKAQEQGAMAVNGLWMLIYQAFSAFEIWTGISPDEEISLKIFEKAKEVLGL